MYNLQNVYIQLKEILQQNPECTIPFEIDCLAEYVIGNKKINLGNDYQVSENDYKKLIECANKRKDGYPIQYILGKWQFFDMELEVGEGVLIPRQDTETVCQNAFEIVNKYNSPSVIDLCSGSGAIALAIKKYCPQANVIALEKSEQAYEYMVKNIKNNNLAIATILEDVFRFDDRIEEGTMDIIIANPPYVSLEYKDELQKEVTFEPEMALFAQDEGLRFYKYIAEYYRNAIADDGYLIFEHGFDQHEKIKDICLRFGYKYIKEITDLTGYSRGIIVQKN